MEQGSPHSETLRLSIIRPARAVFPSPAPVLDRSASPSGERAWKRAARRPEEQPTAARRRRGPRHPLVTPAPRAPGGRPLSDADGERLRGQPGRGQRQPGSPAREWPLPPPAPGSQMSTSSSRSSESKRGAGPPGGRGGLAGQGREGAFRGEGGPGGPCTRPPWSLGGPRGRSGHPETRVDAAWTTLAEMPPEPAGRPRANGDALPLRRGVTDARNSTSGEWPPG